MDQRIERIGTLVERVAQEQKRRALVDEQASLQQARLIRLQQIAVSAARKRNTLTTSSSSLNTTSNPDYPSTSTSLSPEVEITQLRALIARMCQTCDSVVFKLFPDRGRPVPVGGGGGDMGRVVEEHMRRLQTGVDEWLVDKAMREAKISSLNKMLTEKDREATALSNEMNAAQRSAQRATSELRSMRDNGQREIELERQLAHAQQQIASKDREIASLSNQVSTAAFKIQKSVSASGGPDTRDQQIQRLVEMLRQHNINPDTGRGGSGMVSKSEVAALRQRLDTAEAACRAMRDEAKKEVLPVSLRNLRLTHLLGSGSFADVHEGVWEVRCAVKRLKDGVRTNAYEVQKFHREAQMLRSLRHPGILRLMGFSEADFILVMEIMTGGSLHELIHNGPRLELARVMSVAVEIAEVLRFLHYYNIVHRDVKPENLMIDSSGRLRLCDFGLAAEKRGKYVSTRSNLAGTPRYMAPESYRDEPCTEKIDVYSFGMIIWEMHTRSLPWAGRNFSEVRAVVSAGTERPTMPRDCPPDLARLIEDCWAHDPDRRPSASEAISRLVKMGAHPQLFDADDDFHVEAC